LSINLLSLTKKLPIEYIAPPWSLTELLMKLDDITDRFPLSEYIAPPHELKSECALFPVKLQFNIFTVPLYENNDPALDFAVFEMKTEFEAVIFPLME